MGAPSLESRVAELEAKVEELARHSAPGRPEAVPWWRRIWGDFKDDPAYAEAMRLGREFRQSEPLAGDER